MTTVRLPLVVAPLYEECVRSAQAGSGEHAALAVLLADPIVHTDRFVRHADASGVDWDPLLDEPWSSSEEFLLRVAAGLWGRRTTADMSRLPFLDDAHFQLFQDMIAARRTARVPESRLQR
ncbi:hypothetical protein [Nonomuraea sp. NPDC023979]|uniref:hypothetical protein n=1 Tax=Nonomuraea sp. NPDC023979 TaxID=3154796 RepID=UPI0033C7EB42